MTNDVVLKIIYHIYVVLNITQYIVVFLNLHHLYWSY